MHIKTSTFVAAGILAIAGTPVALHLLGGSGKHGTTASWIKTLHGGGSGHGSTASTGSSGSTGSAGSTGSSGSPASTADLSGKWTMTIESDQGNVECRLVLKQDGKKLAGTLSNPHGEGDFPIAGEYTDSAFTLAVDMKTEHGEMHLAFKGSVKKDDGSLAGTMTSAMGESKWTGRRVKD